MKDLLGEKLHVGDYLAYAMRDGCVAEMRIGKVLEIHPKKGLKVRSARFSYWQDKFCSMVSHWNIERQMLKLPPGAVQGEVYALLEGEE